MPGTLRSQLQLCTVLCARSVAVLYACSSRWFLASTLATGRMNVLLGCRAKQAVQKPSAIAKPSTSCITMALGMSARQAWAWGSACTLAASEQVNGISPLLAIIPT